MKSWMTALAFLGGCGLISVGIGRIYFPAALIFIGAVLLICSLAVAKSH